MTQPAHTIDLLIIGGGPAGQAAAQTAAAAGVQTLLIDEGPLPRSWMERQVPRWYGERLPDTSAVSADERRARYLAARPGLLAAQAAGADVRLNHACWGLFDGGVAGIYDLAANTAWLLTARQTIIATGSIDMPLPFQGRSLPGVVGGLAALDLLQADGTLGAGSQRIVILGANPLGLEVARRAQQAGYTIVAIADIDSDAFDSAGTTDPALLADLEAGGTDLIPGYTIAYARGGETLEQVMLTGVDRSGQRVPGATFPVRADTLVVAIGTLPSLELPYLLGAHLHHDARLGGTVPTVSSQMASSIPGVFIVGDAAGASTAAFATADPGATPAATQGRIAAQAVIAALTGTTPTEGEAQVPTVRDAAAPTPATFGGHLTAWHHAAIAVADPDVVICRCEGITLRDIDAATPIVGGHVPDEVKRYTRAGMGQCQGRGCRVIVAGLLAARQQDASLADIPLASYRPPVRPIPLAALAAVDVPDADEPLLPAFAALQADLAADADAGLVTAARLHAAQYKILEENHLARADNLSDAEAHEIAHALRETVRHVTVH